MGNVPELRLARLLSVLQMVTKEGTTEGPEEQTGLWAPYVSSS
jgi:hypothetical protein